MILIKDKQYQSDNAFDMMAKFFKANLFFKTDTIIFYPSSLQDQNLLAVVPTDGINSGCN